MPSVSQMRKSFATLYSNHAPNAVKSTVSSVGAHGSMGMQDWKNLYKGVTSGQQGSLSAFHDYAKLGVGGAAGTYGRMAGTGVAAVGGGAAAVDFANPWGLGWGD